eukprot:6870716-Prymnesium_polylepis.1
MNEVQARLLHYVVVAHRAVVLERFPRKNELLLLGGYPRNRVELLLHHRDGVTICDAERDCIAFRDQLEVAQELELEVLRPADLRSSAIPAAGIFLPWSLAWAAPDIVFEMVPSVCS